MDLICFLHPGWEPQIRPAPATRAWMDQTPEAFAYRCLPLNIANGHGWEVLSPCRVEACWRGGPSTEDVIIRMLDDTPPHFRPVSIFGQGVLTFHVFGLFRTEPGWNLWVSGSPNSLKDGIAPLSGVIETDWSPYTFTMNWKFTRPNLWVRFEVNEPFCFFFPVRRGYLEEVRPQFRSMEEDPELLQQFRMWSRSRDTFRADVDRENPAEPSKKWQKRYYRGLDMEDHEGVETHQVKTRLRPFTASSPADKGST